MTCSVSATGFVFTGSLTPPNPTQLFIAMKTNGVNSTLGKWGSYVNVNTANSWLTQSMTYTTTVVAGSTYQFGCELTNLTAVGSALCQSSYVCF